MDTIRVHPIDQLLLSACAAQYTDDIINALNGVHTTEELDSSIDSVIVKVMEAVRDTVEVSDEYADICRVFLFDYFIGGKCYNNLISSVFNTFGEKISPKNIDGINYTFTKVIEEGVFNKLLENAGLPVTEGKISVVDQSVNNKQMISVSYEDGKYDAYHEYTKHHTQKDNWNEYYIMVNDLLITVANLDKEYTTAKEDNNE